MGRGFERARVIAARHEGTGPDCGDAAHRFKKVFERPAPEGHADEIGPQELAHAVELVSGQRPDPMQDLSLGHVVADGESDAGLMHEGLFVPAHHGFTAGLERVVADADLHRADRRFGLGRQDQLRLL